MRIGRVHSLFLFNAVAAMAGVVAMAALVHAMTAAPMRPAGHATATASFGLSSRLERLAFAAPDAFNGLAADLRGPAELDDEPAGEAEPPGGWSAEVRPAAPPEPAGAAPQPGAAKRPYTLKERLAELSPGASLRLAAKFEAAKASWPPAEIAFVAIKDEKVLELHARSSGGPWTPVFRYRVLAASGGIGPKLRQGDKQVPEGIYRISFLNPNSAYHVSLAVNYPNAFDRQMAAKEGRRNLGGDIMIHGKELSAGCLAMGDEAIEELFVLAAQTGLQNVRLIIAPTDLRQKGAPPADAGRPAWLPKLYGDIRLAMADFKAPQPPRPTGLLSFFMR